MYLELAGRQKVVCAARCKMKRAVEGEKGKEKVWRDVKNVLHYGGSLRKVKHTPTRWLAL